MKIVLLVGEFPSNHNGILNFWRKSTLFYVRTLKMPMMVCVVFIRLLVIDHAYQGSYRTVLRLCQANHLMIKPKPRPKGITQADVHAQKSENLINQNFKAERPNEKCLTDITEIPFLTNSMTKGVLV